MPLERWRPFRLETYRDLAEMQNQVDRVFDDYFGSRSRSLRPGDRVWAPAADIFETKDDVVVTMELPGIKESDIHLTIVDNVLSVRGQRLPTPDVKEEQFHRIERWTGTFERHIQLPIPVQADRVRATYRDGLLEVQLPKVEEIKPRAIKIDVA